MVMYTQTPHTHTGEGGDGDGDGDGEGDDKLNALGPVRPLGSLSLFSLSLAPAY